MCSRMSLRRLFPLNLKNSSFTDDSDKRMIDLFDFETDVIFLRQFTVNHLVELEKREDQCSFIQDASMSNLRMFNFFQKKLQEIFAGPFVLYFSYGLLDAMFQSLVYWVIGALADDAEVLSRYAEFYKGVQSAGATVAWQIDTHNVPFLNELITNWALMTVSYPLLALLIIRAVKDDSEVDGKSKEGRLIPLNTNVELALDSSN